MYVQHDSIVIYERQQERERYLRTAHSKKKLAREREGERRNSFRVYFGFLPHGARKVQQPTVSHCCEESVYSRL
jgi:hypothetical protein